MLFTLYNFREHDDAYVNISQKKVVGVEIFHKVEIFID